MFSLSFVQSNYRHHDPVIDMASVRRAMPRQALARSNCGFSSDELEDMQELYRLSDEPQHPFSGWNSELWYNRLVDVFG